MIYDYFFIKCVFNWSENSVKFENLMGIGFQKGQILWDFISQREVYGVLIFPFIKVQYSSELFIFAFVL